LGEEKRFRTAWTPKLPSRSRVIRRRHLPKVTETSAAHAAIGDRVPPVVDRPSKIRCIEAVPSLRPVEVATRNDIGEMTALSSEYRSELGWPGNVKLSP